MDLTEAEAELDRLCRETDRVREMVYDENGERSWKYHSGSELSSQIEEGEISVDKVETYDGDHFSAQVTREEYEDSEPRTLSH